MEYLLPKHLYQTLDNFLKDSGLTSWSIQSNSKVAAITIRFRLDNDDNTSQKPLDTATKYKRVTEAQQKRDMTRAQSWKGKICSDSSADGKLCEKNNDNPAKTVPTSSHVDSLSTMSSATVTTSDAVSSRTRSRLDSSASAFQPISPVGQVDGPSDPKPRQCFNPQVACYDATSTPAWAKALIAKTDSWSLKDNDDFGFG